MAKQLEMMYEGKAKQVFATDDPTLAVIHYKDDATAFNGLKKGTIVGKGVGSSKKRAEQDAARCAIENLFPDKA